MDRIKEQELNEGLKVGMPRGDRNWEIMREKFR